MDGRRSPSKSLSLPSGSLVSQIGSPAALRQSLLPWTCLLTSYKLLEADKPICKDEADHLSHWKPISLLFKHYFMCVGKSSHTSS